MPAAKRHALSCFTACHCGAQRHRGHAQSTRTDLPPWPVMSRLCLSHTDSPTTHTSLLHLPTPHPLTRPQWASRSPLCTYVPSLRALTHSRTCTTPHASMLACVPWTHTISHSTPPHPPTRPFTFPPTHPHTHTHSSTHPHTPHTPIWPSRHMPCTHAITHHLHLGSLTPPPLLQHPASNKHSPSAAAAHATTFPLNRSPTATLRPVLPPHLSLPPRPRPPALPPSLSPPSSPPPHLPPQLCETARSASVC